MKNWTMGLFLYDEKNDYDEGKGQTFN
jgi:hypothetical protein